MAPMARHPAVNAKLMLDLAFNLTDKNPENFYPTGTIDVQV
jgi:hypothetical protein